jgi:Flp pilus assembly protein protease CpaA
MKNKTIANWIIVSLSLAVLNAILFGELDSLYTLAGLGYIVFGIMAVVRLYKYDEKDKSGNI